MSYMSVYHTYTYIPYIGPCIRASATSQGPAARWANAHPAWKRFFGAPWQAVQ